MFIKDSLKIIEINKELQREIHKHENVRVYSRKTFFILNGNLIFSNSVQYKEREPSYKLAIKNAGKITSST